MFGAITCTWYRPAHPETAEAAIDALEAFVDSVDRRSSGAVMVSLQINVTGNHLGGVVHIEGDEAELAQNLLPSEDFQQRLMNLGALFENWETNLTVGGHEGAQQKEALANYRNAYRNAGVAAKR